MIFLFISVLNTLFTLNQSNIYFMPHDFIFLLLKSTTYKITVRSMAHAAFYSFVDTRGAFVGVRIFLANHSSNVCTCNLKDVSLSFFQSKQSAGPRAHVTNVFRNTAFYMTKYVSVKYLESLKVVKACQS